STRSPASRSAPHDAAEPVSLSRSANGSHSLCQAPAARRCSCSAAAARVASSPGTRRVQPRTAIAATWLSLCGIADEPPRRGPLPARFARSAPLARFARCAPHAPLAYLGHLGLREQG